MDETHTRTEFRSGRLADPVTSWDIQFASGIYLTEELPIEILEKRDTPEGLKAIYDFMESHYWFPLEHSDPEYIWDELLSTARSVVRNYTRRRDERDNDRDNNA